MRPVTSAGYPGAPATRRTAGVLAAALCCVPVTYAADSEFYGLLRSRDLTPFGFLRLDMRPAHAVTIEEGSWAIESELGYQNTWSLSPKVERYLTRLRASGRRDLGPAELQAIRSLPGENYLVDLESASADVTFHYKMSRFWSAYFIASGVSYNGGFLDGLIEGFHDTFGFSSFGRPAVRRDDVNLIYNLKSPQLTSFGAPTSGGFTDPTVGVRYVGFQLPDGWNLSAEAAIKFPVAGHRLLLSTGRTDYGIQGALQRRGPRSAFYLDIAAVYYAGAVLPVPQDSQIIPTLIVGYERAVTGRTNINLQAYISESVYSHQQTDLAELLGRKYQVAFGVRHRIDRVVLSFGVTENLHNINNTPDIGFQLGLAYLPAPISGTKNSVKGQAAVMFTDRSE